MAYVAVAYRYGWNNGHWYIVAASGDLEAVTKAAEEENKSRGGKYGIEVYEIGLGDTEEKALCYFPSAWDEKKPRLCIKQEVWEKVGFYVLDVIHQGKSLDMKDILEQEKYQTEIAKIFAGPADIEKNPPSPMRERVDELLSLMLTTKRENTEEWMEYIVEQMNRLLEDLCDEERVIYRHGEIYKTPRVVQ